MYQWGTGSIFFNLNPVVGKPLSSFSPRKQRIILHSGIVLPQDYLVNDQGFIIPSSYIPVRFVEGVFHTPKSFNYFHNNSSKARSRLDKNASPTFSDQLILAASQDLLHSLFRVREFSELQPFQKREYLLQIQRRLSADIGQISRATGISYEEAGDLINSI